ncbi:hypothetical protein LCGC14_2908090 [marine sediment metagenome]|uniref:IPT/TIG domain-containing protein n=1 Tax=marine sediment metagenome TaxID=412755 RepID=A0A0F9A044_9ZZZZ
MVQINEVSPSRFRVGDLITIRGFGFSPTFGANEVAIAGIPEIVQSESATELTLLVPAGIPVDQYVSVFVFRNDTNDNDSNQAWSKGALDSIRDASLTVPGQVPGTTEAADPSRVEDVPQAQDYERYVTAIEHLLRDVLTFVGDLFAFNGTSLKGHPIGAAGQRLGAEPINPTGMEYAAITRAQTLQWAGRKLAADTVVDAIVANGPPGNTSIVNGLHLSPITGNVYTVSVLFAQGTAGDTLDQVIIRINGVIQYDSLIGLGIGIGATHSAAIAVAVVGGTDTVELEVKKLGVAGDADFVGHVGVR